MDNVDISGVLTTKRDELDFTDGDAYANKEGNICIRFDEDSYAILTPVMAKRLNKLISEAVSSSLALLIGHP
jgi:hypothetical protein